MAQVDTSLFADIADMLKISSPDIVEKDYWAMQMLELISKLKPEGYTMVFSGGTCLAKAHKNTFRMSEDIDIKLIPIETTSSLAKNQQKKLRSTIHNQLLTAINNSAAFSLTDKEGNPKKRDESRYQQFLVEYPRARTESNIGSLRPHLQIELTESMLLEPSECHELKSMYAEALKSSAEVTSLKCVSVGTTACEKFISLLRRTSAAQRNSMNKDDETLIRHVYDLHLIIETLHNIENLKSLVEQVIETDKLQSNKHPEYIDNPVKELQYGLELLKTQSIYKQRYDQFIGPLVYHPSPATWEEAIASVEKLAQIWLVEDRE